MEIKAYAKINLTLDVLRKRPDGYHDLRGVMCAISLHDKVYIEPGDEIRFCCDIPLPENNTAVKAVFFCLGINYIGKNFSSVFYYGSSCFVTAGFDTYN